MQKVFLTNIGGLYHIYVSIEQDITRDDWEQWPSYTLVDVDGNSQSISAQFYDPKQTVTISLGTAIIFLQEQTREIFDEEYTSEHNARVLDGRITGL